MNKLRLLKTDNAMYKYILDSVNQIDWMAIIPLIIFFSFFTGTVIVTMRKNKSFISKMKNMPFENELSEN